MKQISIINNAKSKDQFLRNKHEMKINMYFRDINHCITTSHFYFDFIQPKICPYNFLGKDLNRPFNV